jgi:hypothetical protein
MLIPPWRDWSLDARSRKLSELEFGASVHPAAFLDKIGLTSFASFLKNLEDASPVPILFRAPSSVTELAP